MKQVNVKKLLILNLPYLLFVWLFDKAAQTVRLSPGADLSGKLLNLGSGFSQAMESIAPSFHPADLLVGLIGAVVIRLIIYTKGKNAKKYRKGMEYGSARWGTAEDIKPYIDPVFENNVLLTQTERLMMSNRPKNPKYARNKNILVIGGSGSGKTRFFVKPNLMQLHSSYVVTDPKGTLILETGSLLVRAGYKVKVLNTINFKKSMHYNPFAYLRSEKDILKLTNTIIANTKGDGEKSSEDFWVKAERLLYCALIGYIWYEAPEGEKNFITLYSGMEYPLVRGNRIDLDNVCLVEHFKDSPLVQEAVIDLVRALPDLTVDDRENFLLMLTDPKNHLKNAEVQVEDDYGMIDGIINNGERSKDKEPGMDKPSVLGQLSQAKKECAERKPPELGKPGKDEPEL